MTVRDLIEELSKLDPDLVVLVEGYEGGYSIPTVTEPRRFRVEGWYVVGKRDEGLFGAWDALHDRDEPADGDVLAIVLER